MYSWRIAKYDPIYRNDKGHFLKDEWTSISDIGRVYHDKILTISDYLVVENLYVDAVISFMKCLKLSSLKIKSLENYLQIDDIGIKNHPEIYSNKMITLFNKVQDGDVLGLQEVELICRLVLREDKWCKLKYKSKMFVHFGDDYYMYIGSSSKCSDVIEKITASGLFVEPFISPYIK